MDCIFCKIVAGQMATDLLGQNDHAVAFADINPVANVHILVIPKIHSANVSEISAPEVLVGIHELVKKMADEFTDGEFRLIFNTGQREGQSVFHTHAHITSQFQN